MIENSVVQTPVISFVVGKIKPTFTQKHQTQSHKAILHIEWFYHLFSSYCDLASTFNVLTYTAATSHVADYSDDE